MKKLLLSAAVVMTATFAQPAAAAMSFDDLLNAVGDIAGKGLAMGENVADKLEPVINKTMAKTMDFGKNILDTGIVQDVGKVAGGTVGSAGKALVSSVL